MKNLIPPKLELLGWALIGAGIAVLTEATRREVLKATEPVSVWTEADKEVTGETVASD